jgi:hypothetical protein
MRCGSDGLMEADSKPRKVGRLRVREPPTSISSGAALGLPKASSVARLSHFQLPP